MSVGDKKNFGKNFGLSGPPGHISAGLCLFPAKNQDFNFNFFDFFAVFSLFFPIFWGWSIFWLWWSPKCQIRNNTVTISSPNFFGNFNDPKQLPKKIIDRSVLWKKFASILKFLKKSHKSNFFVLIRTLRKEKFKLFIIFLGFFLGEYQRTIIIQLLWF